jgi:DNA-binding transcriptional LysR family regulator
VELRHLRYFVAVAEELHFRRAAERLSVAQPAVSEQVRKLELELGVRLFDRTHRSVSLTDAGAALLEEARRVLRQAEIAEMAARNAGDRATRRMRIGHVPGLLPSSLARAVRVMGAASPRVQIHLETGAALRLIGELRAERLDAVVVGLPAPTSKLRVTPAGHQRAVLALPVAHPQAVSAAISLERLLPERLVVLPPDTNPAFHSAVVSLCRGAGFSPTLVEVAEPRVEHVLFAVASGAGMALLPESAAERHASPGVRFVPLERAEPAFESVMLTRPGADDLATANLVRAVAYAVKPVKPVEAVVPAQTRAIPLVA